MELTITRRAWNVSGNIVITIPKEIVKKLKIKENDLVEARIRKV